MRMLQSMMKKGGGMAGAAVMAVTWLLPAAVAADQLVLAENGKTAYRIIKPASPSAIDDFAVAELTGFLGKVCGVEFPVFTGNSDEAEKLTHRIFVGSSPAAAKLFRMDTGALQDQEHVVKNIRNDIFLSGKGEYGNLYAVYSFLGNQLGCRWYTVYGDMLIPERKTAIPSFDYKRSFAFPIRSVMNWFYKKRPETDLFFYRNFQNQLLFTTPSLPGLKPVYHEIPPGIHTSFAYMPPGDKALPGDNPPVPWLKDKSFFTTNPEFFSMNEQGVRVRDRQLCFSNPGLRKQLQEHIERQLAQSGGEGVVTIDANDRGGRFCYCSDCREMEKKYQTPGGPILDFLIAACRDLQEKYPKAYLKSSAYRKLQTEIPPGNLAALPDNLIMIFAPIEDNILAPLSHPDNAQTYEHLKKWCALSRHVWVWYYPNPYISTGFLPPPVGNLERLAEDIRLLKQAGVEGTYFEHDSGVGRSANFSELQTWLMLKLFQDPEQQLDAPVREFTDYYYGRAAGMLREYIQELEQARSDLLAAKVFWRWNTQPSQYTYITADKLMAWEKKFDAMEVLTQDQAEHNFHVRLARMSLDAFAIVKWKHLIGKYPEMAAQLDMLRNRLSSTYRQMAARRMPGMPADIGEWLHPEEEVPVPGEFREITPELLFQVNPDYPNKLHSTLVARDSEAAWGVANVEQNDQNPYRIGFYDTLNKKSGVSRVIQREEIVSGKYRFYRLGKIKVTPGCIIWGGKWYISVNLGHLYSIDEPDAEYEAYVSLKFEGPAYGGTGQAEDNRVLCDRVILVKQLDAAALAAGKLDRPPARELPAELGSLPGAAVYQVNPDFPVRLPDKLMMKDADAAWGAANFELNHQLPYKIGFYDLANKKSILHRPLDQNDITPDQYRFYKLGKVKLTPKCIVWGGNWLISVNLSHLYSAGRPDTEYEVYVSLKFEGPAYGGKSEINRILCDRVVLVRQ